jgi:hypothetical protein
LLGAASIRQRSTALRLPLKSTDGLNGPPVLHHLNAEDAWEFEGFLDGLHGLAMQYQVEGDFGFAAATSIRRLSNSRAGEFKWDAPSSPLKPTDGLNGPPALRPPILVLKHNVAMIKIKRIP